MVYDIEVRAVVDGFTSDAFRLHINKPNRLTQFYSQTVANDICSPGYRTEIYYKVYDLWNNELIQLKVNEQHSSPSTPNGSNWPNPTDDSWRPGEEEEWPEEFIFLDTLFAGSCIGLVPSPTGPGDNGSLEDVQFLSKQTTQEIYVGSLVSGEGARVQRKHAKWYLDHAKVEAIP
jgi:hypothetical protein